jgi:hypothetical protein
MKKIVSLLICLGGLSIVKAQKEPPSPPPPPKAVEVKKTVAPAVTASGKEADTFYKRNPAIDKVSRKGDIITLKMKDKTTEKYDLGKQEEEKTFRGKYGEPPVPPPPPPPPPKPKD